MKGILCLVRIVGSGLLRHSSAWRGGPRDRKIRGSSSIRSAGKPQSSHVIKHEIISPRMVLALTELLMDVN